MEEEILMEIEALKAIYMDDFKELEEQPYRKIQIVLLPNPGTEDNHVGLTLEITLTQNYPNELPQYKVRDTFGMDTKQIKTLEELVKAKGEESLGMPMVYNLASACKEWLDDNNISEEQRTKLQSEKEEEERMKKRSEGVPVTLETFNAWKSKFYAAKELEWKRQSETKRLTGKQMFEGNAELVLSDAAFAEDEGEESVTVDWNLFKQELEDIPDDDEDASEEK